MALDDKGGHGTDDVGPDDKGGLTGGAVTPDDKGGHGLDDVGPDDKGGRNHVFGTAGDDRLLGTSGRDVLHGGGGDDTAVFTGNASQYQFTRAGTTIFVNGPDGRDTLVGIEHLEFADGVRLDASTLTAQQAAGPIIAISHHGDDFSDLADLYSGPVAYLNCQYLGSNGREAVHGTSQNDFLNLLGDDDAADAGGGDDVLDGGTGSNFLSGGTGWDTFFLDGRGGQTSWATITDWQGGEHLSLWGWRPGVSKADWVSSAGAAGYQGVTLHADLDGNGSIDTSVTWTGKTEVELPKPHEMDGLLWFA